MVGPCEIEGTVSFFGKAVIKYSTIGTYSYFVDDCVLSYASVGRYNSVARRVEIGTIDHPTEWLTTSPFPWNDTFRPGQLTLADAPVKPARTTLGHDVWIGSDVTVVGGVTIGTGSIVGTRSVVTKDVPPYSIVAGNPARIIRQRFDDHVAADLLASEWWEYDLVEFVRGGGSLKWADPRAALTQIETLSSVGLIKRIVPRKGRFIIQDSAINFTRLEGYKPASFSERS